MTDLAARLRAVVEERLAVARAATPGPWQSGDLARSVVDRNRFVIAKTYRQRPDVEHIALNDPDDVIRACERDLAVLQRHKPVDPYDLRCRQCYAESPWPCDDIRDLATRYRVEADG